MPSKLSIIVPVFNKADFLPDTLESLLAQSHEDCEFIVVDDKSTDGSLEIMREYARRDQRFKIICRAKNGGLSLARNTGLDHAIGDFVLFWDADDILREGSSKRLIKLAESKNADVVKAILLRRNPKRTWVTERHKQIKPTKGLVSLNEYPSLLLDISSCSYLLRREYLTRNKIRFRSGLYMQDVLFSLQVYTNTTRILVSDIRIGEYVQGHDAQRGSSIISESRFHSLKKLLDFLIQEITSKAGDTSAYKHHVFETYINASLNTFYLDAVKAYKRDKTNRDRLIEIQILLLKIPEASFILHSVLSKNNQIMYELLLLRSGLIDEAVALRHEGRLPNYREMKHLLNLLEFPTDLVQTMNHLADSRERGTAPINVRTVVKTPHVKKSSYSEMTKRDIDVSLDGLSSVKVFSLLIRRVIRRLSFHRLGM